ncbi:Uncharacterized protein DBV15_07566 [Temnothorax longispinosus]|uniref:Uncharacterized protein n=1 Tax=Temnothorax longispinosus TaxID=300112 RepID=A0A4S2KSJ5_9HYME|nr:Uncharacterized protein DBV15_07566 [Temnothorax longispinosus]
MSERARQKNPPILFLILSKEDTSTNAFPLRLGPTLPIGSFRQNEPLVFCHYPLEVVIFGSLRPPSSEVAASDFRAPRYRFVTVIRWFGEKPKVHRRNVTCVIDSAPTSSQVERMSKFE